MSEKTWLETIFCCCNRGPPIVKREITLGCFGIGGAGKTTFLTILKGEDPRLVLTTNGFSTIEMDFDERFHVKVFDVGGDRGIRGIWSNYYGEVYGVIYVIDYTTDETFEESIEALRSVSSHPQVQNKPILLVVNNQNNKELDDVEIMNMTDIQAGQHKCVLFTHFNRYNGYLNSAKQGQMTVAARAKKDKLAFQETFVRFIDTISASYDELSEGVRLAEQALKLRQEQAKEERRLCLMKAEHDREKNEMEDLEMQQHQSSNPVPAVPPPGPKPAAVRLDESPPMSLASSTIPSDIVQGSPEVSSVHDPVNFCRISQTSTKPVSPESNERVQVVEPPQTILRDNYFLPPKIPGRQYSRIQRIQNVLRNRVVPK